MTCRVMYVRGPEPRLYVQDGDAWVDLGEGARPWWRITAPPWNAYETDPLDDDLAAEAREGSVLAAALTYHKQWERLEAKSYTWHKDHGLLLARCHGCYNGGGASCEAITWPGYIPPPMIGPFTPLALGFSR